MILTLTLGVTWEVLVVRKQLLQTTYDFFEVFCLGDPQNQLICYEKIETFMSHLIQVKQRAPTQNTLRLSRWPLS